MFAWRWQVYASSQLYSHLILDTAAYVAATIIYAAATAERPVSWRRDVASLVIDFAGIALQLQSTGEAGTPIMLILLWAGGWYAVRLGMRLMAVAIVACIAMLLLLWLTNPYWQVQPHLTATLMIMAGVLPACAAGLMTASLTADRRMAQHMAARSRLIARVSHDLRHPLHALGIFNARLAGTELTPHQHELVGHIDAALHNSTELLQAYLDLADIESNQIRPTPTVFALQSLFDEIAVQARAAAERAGVRFRFMPTARYVRADRVLLKAIIQNLVANVLRHAPGSRAVIGSRLDRTGYALQVRDSGVRTAPAANDATPLSYGLGLTIVRDLARTQKCRVWINDRTRRGFDIRIVGLTPAEPDDVPVLPGRLVEFQPLRGTRILLVEEDAAVRMETTALLQQWGCHVASLAELPAGRTDCDVAVIDARARRRSANRTLDRLGVPVILIGDASARNDELRRSGGTLIQAVRPVPPAQLRSMLMSVR